MFIFKFFLTVFVKFQTNGYISTAFQQNELKLGLKVPFSCLNMEPTPFYDLRVTKYVNFAII